MIDVAAIMDAIKTRYAAGVELDIDSNFPELAGLYTKVSTPCFGIEGEHPGTALMMKFHDRARLLSHMKSYYPKGTRLWIQKIMEYPDAVFVGYTNRGFLVAHFCVRQAKQHG